MSVAAARRRRAETAPRERERAWRVKLEASTATARSSEAGPHSHQWPPHFQLTARRQNGHSIVAARPAMGASLARRRLPSRLDETRACMFTAPDRDRLGGSEGAETGGGIRALYRCQLVTGTSKALPVDAAKGTRVRPGRRMRRVCTGTPVHCENTVMERVARPGRRLRRVVHGYTGILWVYYEHTVRLRWKRN